MAEGKKPRSGDKRNYIGLEVECFIPKGKKTEIEMAFRERKVSGVFGTDGSLRLDTDMQQKIPNPQWKRCHSCEMRARECCDWCRHGKEKTVNIFEAVEIRFLINQEEYKEKIKSLFEVLNASGARVNNSCGLHVHLDMRNRNRTKSLLNLVAHHGILKKCVARNRLKNTYCKIDSDKRIREVLKEPMFVGNLENHYHWLNYNKKYTTFEVRLHEGTMDGGKALFWVSLLTKIVDGEFNVSKPNTMKSFQQSVTEPETVEGFKKFLTV